MSKLKHYYLFYHDIDHYVPDFMLVKTLKGSYLSDL
jgi:hypothetical protein